MYRQRKTDSERKVESDQVDCFTARGDEEQRASATFFVLNEGQMELSRQEEPRSWR